VNDVLLLRGAILAAAVAALAPAVARAQASGQSAAGAPGQSAPVNDPAAPQGVVPTDPDATPTATGTAHAHAKRRAFLCKNSRSPRNRPFECNTPWYEELLQDVERAWSWVGREAATLGVVPSLSYTAQVVTNTSGTTPSGPQEIVYGGQVNGSVAVDFHKLASIPGFSFYVDAAWGTGGEFAVGPQGNFFSPASAAAGTGFWLGQLYLQQVLLKGNLNLAVGRLGPGATFATLPVFGNYLNAAINANPAALGINLPAFPPPPPGSQWGAQAIWYPTGNWQVAAGVYNNNPNSAAGADHGADFRWSEGNQGVLAMGQASYLLYQGSTDDEGPPGQYTLGAFHDGNTFPVLPGGATSATGNWGLYAMFQQAVFQAGGPNGQIGLTAWGALSWQPQTDRNTMPWSFMAGLSYQGLVPGRATDVLSLGWSSGRVSPAIPGVSTETVIEVNYQYNVASWLAVTPDFQYVWRPGGLSVVGAAVAGFQAVVTL
jgi:porin